MTGEQFSKLLEVLQEVKEAAIKLEHTEPKGDLGFLALGVERDNSIKSAALTILYRAGII